LVGLLVAPRLRALNDCHTLGDAIGQKYNRTCQVFSGIISVSVCTFLAAVMAHAGKVILNDMFGLPGWLSVIIVVGITALYTTSGGLRASVITDAFQFSAFAILLPATLLIALAFHLKGGPSDFAGRIVSMTQRGLASHSPLQIAGLIAAFLLGETLIPPYANRALASKTTGTSRNGFVLAGLFSVAWFTVMVSLGVAAHGIIPEGTDEDYVLLRLVGAIMSDAGHALLMLILVSVVMSSLDSLMNAGAVAFTQDIIKPAVTLTDEAALRTGRWATVAIAVVASTATRVVPSIIDGLLICYTIWAAGVLPVLILGLWVKQPRPLAGILSMAVGTVVSMIAIIFLFAFPEAVGVQVIIVPALGAALLAYAFGHWMGARRAGGIR